MQTKIVLFGWFILCCFGTGSAQNYTPVGTSGYNIDAVAEATPAMNYTSDVLDGSDYVMYTMAYGQLYSSTGGVPNNGYIVNGNHTFQMQPFDQHNVLRIMAGITDSLTLTTPARYARLSLLGFATEGTGNIDVQLKFSDGSTLLYAGQPLPDWFTGSGATVILNGFDRAGRASGNPDNLFSQPYMYALDLTIASCTDQAKNLEKIIVHNNGSNARICLLGISGVAMSGTNVVNICQNDTFYYNNHAYFATGTYTDTLPSLLGCDSVISTNLTVMAVSTTNNPQTICSGSAYGINGHVYTTDGVYNDTLQSVTGCDSIIVTNLTVLPPLSAVVAISICQGASYSFNGHTYSTTGTYADTLQNGTGCDSIVMTELTVNPSFTINNAQTICAGSTYTINNHQYSTAGIYADTLQSGTGCDSIVVTTLTVDTTAITTNLHTICENSTYAINGHTYTSAGTYYDTLQSHTGCDSILVTVLTVDTLPAIAFSIPAPNDTLCDQEAAIPLNGTPGGGVYAGSAGISGASFDPSTAPASLNTIVYTVSSGACTDSAWANVFVEGCTGLPALAAEDGVAVYPNPATDQIHVDVQGKGSTVTLMTMDGQVIAQQAVNGQATLNISAWPSGLYLLKFDSREGAKVFRVIKQ